MSVFDAPDYDDHQEVHFIRDVECGLKAIIAIHSTGKARISGGGCRFHPYPDSNAALQDVLKLSKAMSHKMALAGMPIGGGKTVVIGDPAQDKTDDLLRALGTAIHHLGGRYFVGEDVGTNAHDMAVIAEVTPYVTKKVGIQNTAIPTGYGVFVGIREAARAVLDREDLTGLKVAIQGVGAVGQELCKHLARAGAQLWVTDIDPTAIEIAVAEFSVQPVSPEDIYALDVDVFAPCALGGSINDETIPRLRCAIVCGAANNQLRDVRHARALRDRSILYVPDVVANAGAVIGAIPGTSQKDSLKRTDEKISEVFAEVLKRSRADDVSTHEAAEALARERMG